MSALLLCGFAAGYGVLSFQIEAPNPVPDATFNHLKSEFTRHSKPIATLFSSQYEQEHPSELRDLKLTLPNFSSSTLPELQALYRYAETCEANPFPHTAAFKKAWIWHQYLCRNLLELPKSFFANPPFLHPSGSSFAFFAVTARPELFSNPEWVKENRERFHVSEWKKLPSETAHSIEPLLSDLSDDAIRALNFHQSVLLTSHEVGFQNEKSLDYQFYDLQSLNAFFSKGGIQLTQANEHCNLKLGNACVQEDRRSFFRQFRIRSLVILGLILVLSLTLLILLIRSLKNQDQLNQRTKLAFQILSHELRTPLASLVLQGERLRNSYDRLSSEGQDALLFTLNDIERLVRVTEMSKHYLNVPSQAKKNRIASLKELLESITRDFNSDRIEMEAESDSSIEADESLLRLALSNLVRNAISHGKGKIKIKIFAHENSTQLLISDEGSGEWKSLADLKKSSSQNKGLGIGLTLTEHLLQENEVELRFEANPTTTFTLIFKNSRRGTT